MALPQPILDVMNRIQRHWFLPDYAADGEKEGPYWRLVRSFGEVERGNEAYRRLAWLAHHASRRALSRWEAECDGREPHEAVDAVHAMLTEGRDPNRWKPLTKPAAPTAAGKKIVDDRYGFLYSASESAAAAARFVQEADPVDALRSIALADLAFDESPGKEDAFRAWLCQVAIPAAWDQRDLKDVEREALRKDRGP